MLIRPLLLLTAAAIATGCQSSADEASPAAMIDDERVALVEAACGQCQFGLPGDGCDLAVRIDGNAYFVDGTSIDDHGDAHAADGFCNAVRRARVTGALIDGRYVARSFELVAGDGG